MHDEHCPYCGSENLYHPDPHGLVACIDCDEVWQGYAPNAQTWHVYVFAAALVALVAITLLASATAPQNSNLSRSPALSSLRRL